MGGWGPSTASYGWFTSVASQQKAYGDAFLASPGRAECEPGGDVLLRGCANGGTDGTGDRVPGLRRTFRPRFASRSNLGAVIPGGIVQPPLRGAKTPEPKVQTCRLTPHVVGALHQPVQDPDICVCG